VKKLCCIATPVLLIIVALMAYKFLFQGAVTPSTDGRTAILLNDEERNLVLAEMRTFLVSTQQIVAALNTGDSQQVVAAAKAVGAAAQQQVPGTLIAKLPMEFKKLGFDTHQKFDLLALDAEQLGDKGQTLEQLAQLLQNCVACHAGYRIDLEITAK